MSRRRLVPMIAAALALAACKPETQIDQVRITSPAQLPQAIVAVDYSFAVEVTGGTPPFTFSAAIPGNIDWLAIDPATGVLAGTPDAVQSPAVAFPVQVVDANQQTATATLSLQVAFCAEGETRACSSTGTGQCLTSTYVCASGAFPQCPTNGTPSTNVDACGADCTPCDRAKADRCEGTCSCGGGSACGAATTCCAGGCVDTGTDAANCGACGTACTAAPAFARPVCAAGGCDFACDDGYTRCGDACVKLADDASNCGSCGNVCQGLDAGCSAGQCYASCPNGTTNCNGACLAPTAFQTDVANCGACGRVCTAPPGAHPTCTGGSCGFACDGGGTYCNGACVDTSSDVSNCGGCGNVCPSSGGGEEWFCSGGSCDFGCATGYFWCDVNGACQRTGTLCRDLCGKYVCKLQ